MTAGRSRLRASKPRDCLYCENRPERTHESHAFSQALHQNQHKFPRGFICKRCEGYFATDVDEAVTHHPHVHHWIQYLGLPGRNGRTRPRLGGVVRDPDGSCFYATVQLEGEITTVGDRRRARVRILPGPKYDDRLISRALYFYALNLDVLNEVERLKDAEAARAYGLSPAFDKVARYVRGTTGEKEFWPFAERVLPTAGRIGANAFRCPGGKLVIVGVLGVEFAVALPDHENLEARLHCAAIEGMSIIRAPRKRSRARTKGERYQLVVPTRGSVGTPWVTKLT